MAMIIG